MERREFLKITTLGVGSMMLPSMPTAIAAENVSMNIAYIYPIRGLREVLHNHVELDRGFWGDRQNINNKVTLPHTLDQLEKEGHVTNFDRASGKWDGPLRGHHAYDSDLHKVLEGAMHSLQHYDNKELFSRVESIFDRVMAAQQDDGFLISYFIGQNEDQRWQNMRLDHQAYNAGHYFEAAVEHHRLTGQNEVLGSAKKFADHIDDIFGENKRYDVGGHQEIELALIKLYRTTGDKKYLDLSRFFLDERGHAHGEERAPHKIIPLPATPRLQGQSNEEHKIAVRNTMLRWRNGRMQDHKPLIEQDAVGHGVRAGYTYSAMADMARFSDAPNYEKALDRIWKDVIGRKMYITGGIGTHQYKDEGFGDPYLLPNDTYCESCASMAHILWQHRMALLKADAKYIDVMELALYNGALSGLSIKGDTFFYENPLESEEGESRLPWHFPACCPSNYSRIIPQIGGFIYACNQDKVFVNLFAAGTAKINMGEKSVNLSQKTNYPWDGLVNITVDDSADFTMCIRIPGWAQGHPVPGDLYHYANTTTAPIALSVNGNNLNATISADGYVHLKRNWQSGDVVRVNLPMTIKRTYAHENIEADRGKIALMRGPVVYCVEAADNPGLNFKDLRLSEAASLTAYYDQNLLGGITTIKGKAITGNNEKLLTAIPYFAWANREKGAMTVWIDEVST